MSDYYPKTLFHELILGNAEKFGKREALVQNEQVIVFEDIPMLVSKLVSKFGELGLTAGDSILVCLPNSIWYPLLFLAAAKIGVVLTGISSESTANEVKFALKESGATLVFTDETITKDNSWVLSEVVVEILPEDVKSYIVLIPDLSKDVSLPELSIDSILLAPFSSGTTGEPKCCLLTHRNFLASTFALKKFFFDELLARSSMKTLAFLPFHHASGFWALLFCLLEGCTTYIMAEFHPIGMMDMVEKYEIDTINIVPAIANVFLKMGFLQNRCPSLRTVLCGSSGLSKDRCKRFLSLFPQVQNFIQGYGMTEMVVLSCVTPIDDKFEHIGSCGRLLPGFDVKFLEHDVNETELLLRSDAIMKFYKNGDIVTEKEGFYYVVDRMKDLIKVNGFQVSPTEIENVILQFPKVLEVAVVGIEDELCGQLPKAYIVLEKDADELLFRKHLDHTMKEKMSAVKQLRGGVSIIQEMPKSASGKIQKRKLFYL